MNIKQLESNLTDLEKKYFNNQENIKEYYQDIMNNLYDYLDKTYDDNVLNYFNNIITGEDLGGSKFNVNPNSLYYWLGNFKVAGVDYKMLKDLSKKTIKEISKINSKRKDLEL